MQWVLKHPDRFLKEKEAIVDLAGDVEWLSNVEWLFGPNAVLCMNFDLAVHGKMYKGVVTFPDLFPDIPAIVQPRDATERWSEHQYGAGGSLCLEWRPDNWLPTVTAADLLRSTHKLLLAEQDPEHAQPVLSAHRETLGQRLSREAGRLVVTPGLVTAIAQVPVGSAAKCKAHLFLHDGTCTALVSSATLAAGVAIPISDVPQAFDLAFSPAWNMPGRILRSDSFPEGPVPEDLEGLITFIAQAGFARDCLEITDGNVSRQLVLLSGSRIGLRAVRTVKDDPKLFSFSVIDAQSGADIPSETAALASQRIGIVGLGSLGSKVAVSLARSGIKRLLLIDDDVLLPKNIRRHELKWTEVGATKVVGVKELIAFVDGNVTVDFRSIRIGGQISALAASAALKDLSSCNAIVDATANAAAFLPLAAVSRASKIPLFWGEVFAGGIGGLIAQARPGLEPNPLAARAAIHEYLDKQPPAPFMRATGYDVEADDAGLPAYDSDVGQIAAALTRLVVDVAAKRTPTTFIHGAYLIGLKSEWIFEAPFHTQPLTLSGPGWDETAQRSPQDLDAALAELLKMIPKDADSNITR